MAWPRLFINDLAQKHGSVLGAEGRGFESLRRVAISQFSFSDEDEGAPGLAFENWVSAKADSLRVVVHPDSISTVLILPVR